MISERTKKVLVLTSTFPRWADDMEPRFVELLSLELAEYHDVTVLAPHCRGAKTHESIESGNRKIQVYRFRYLFDGLETLAYNGGILTRIRGNFMNVLLVPFFLVGQFLKLNSLHRKFGFDVIHAHWIIPQGIVAAAYRRISKDSPALLITSHGGDLFALRGKLLTRLKCWILRAADQITVVSEAMKHYCHDLDIDPDRIRVRPMGVNLQSIFTKPDSDDPRAGLIFVGRLVEKKGVSVLINAMSILVSQHPEIELTVVGNGPDESTLRKLTNSRGLDKHIKFSGSKLNTELPALLRQAKIFVMPSVIAKSGDQEGLGLVAVEAMGCGCAVVATDLPAIRDTVIHEKTGLISKAGDVEDLAEKIDKLLNADDYRASLAEAGNAFANERFDWNAVGTGYAELISGIHK